MKVVAKNRRARFDYDILETIEAGVMLTGPEVKSCRSGSVHLPGSYVSFIGGSIVLKNMSIAPYPYAAQGESYVPAADRRLLLKMSEEARLKRAVEEKGITVIPLEVRAGRFVKLLLGVARGRRRYEKRDRIRERDLERRLKQGEEV